MSQRHWLHRVLDWVEGRPPPGPRASMTGVYRVSEVPEAPAALPDPPTDPDPDPGPVEGPKPKAKPRARAKKAAAGPGALQIKVNGKVVYEGPSGGVDVRHKPLSTPVTGQNWASYHSTHTVIRTTLEGVTLDGVVGGPGARVEINGDVTGPVNTDLSVTCRNVGGDVHAGVSVTCGDVQGRVEAGVNVTARDIHGRVDAGVGVTARTIHK